MTATRDDRYVISRIGAPAVGPASTPSPAPRERFMAPAATPDGPSGPRKWDLAIVGAHGGAGASTLAAAAHALEVVGQPYRSPSLSFVVVARSSAYGIERARQMLAAATLDVGADVLALALVPDAPGKLPRPLRELALVIAGAVPRVIVVPWLEELRYAARPPAQAPPKLRSVVDEIRSLRPSRPAGA